MGEDQYLASKAALQDWLLRYFRTGDCRNVNPGSINPLGVTEDGGKALKVRWALPGQGRRGGLRLLVVAFCEEQHVQIRGAYVRNVDPPPDEVAKLLKP